MLMAIAHIVQFFIFSKITKCRKVFENLKKRVFFTVFEKKALKLKI